MFSSDDQHFMLHAVQLAERGRFTTRPNPRVGCVIVKNGGILAEGWHYRAGEPHAEVQALKSLDQEATAGATVYVTLEPCSHHGKTGPCVQALIDAGVSRVIYGMRDPNPLVGGKGLTMLEAAGIVTDGPLLEAQTKALNVGFISRMQRQRPWVRCKLAASIDGGTAMANGESQWITGTAARSDVQRWRAQSCALVTGIGSIEQDNSRLTLRKDELPLDNVDDVIKLAPLRVVLDTRLRISPDAAIFAGEGKVLVFVGKEAPEANEKRLLKQWPDKVLVERVDTCKERLDLAAVLEILANHYQCNEILLEAGATLSGSFLRAGLLDEVIIYQAPILLGSCARPLFDLPLDTMSDKVSLQMTDQRAIGHDWRWVANVMTRSW
ncbi:riboflavin biosynthesis protein RibD [Candidatus Endobugula sertula]|uniref:Riboflavin biosynthesis protein RibD n=1 Tax=Candidatus Endobugula sertula TaxID=62101 RepID=A0A1D2QRX0_9GAMM|nr:riboflavin biosynthesis protein RibD [Candidatus Endobugula sertula]